MNYTNYTTEQKITIARNVQRLKNKASACLKPDISVRSYYYWLAEFRDTGTITNESRYPKNSPNSLLMLRF